MANYLSNIDANVVSMSTVMDTIYDDAAMPRNEKLHKLEKTVNIAGRLIEELTSVLSRARTSLNRLTSGAARLSTEAITEIILCLPVDRISHRLAASQVCRIWREASQHPRVWSHISVEVRTPEIPPKRIGIRDTPHCRSELRERATITSTMHQLEGLLERSMSVPVHISLTANAHCDNALDGFAQDFKLRLFVRNILWPTRGAYTEEGIGKLFPNWGKPSPLGDFLLHVSRVADRLVSLELTLRCCETWLLFLPCLPPMTALRTLTIRSPGNANEKLLVPDSLYGILSFHTASLSLLVTFPALETLRISGLTGKSTERPGFPGVRRAVLRSRVRGLLECLPKLKRLDISLMDWPRFITPDNLPEDLDWYDSRPEEELDELPPNGPRLASLGNLTDIRLCSERGSQSHEDIVQMNRIMDVLPINPGCNLRVETHGDMREESYEQLLAAFHRRRFRPTRMTAIHRKTEDGTCKSRICAEDDYGTVRSVLSSRASKYADLCRYCWAGIELSKFLDTGMLKSLTVDAAMWNELAYGFVAPVLENLTFVLPREMISNVANKVSYTRLTAPALRTISFETDEWDEDETEPAMVAQRNQKTSRPAAVHVSTLEALLRAVWNLRAEQIEKVRLSPKIKLILDLSFDSLKQFSQSIIMD